jgi:5-bromo-4-chloroindolyl phosphate hydrolysis protein
MFPRGVESSMKDKFDFSIIFGIIGGGVFLGFLFILKFNFFIALGLGGAAFIASSILFSKNKDIEIVVDGITREKYNEILESGSKKLKIMKGYLTQVNNAEVKEKIRQIGDVVEKIFDDLKKDPKDVKAAREFLNYYLDTTINIINRYIDISNRNIQTAKIKETLTRVEGLLDTIKQAFEKQLAKLLNDDLLDLDTEIKVLEQTMKVEGME